MSRFTIVLFALLTVTLFLSEFGAAGEEIGKKETPQAQSLFTAEGTPEGWLVRSWSDVAEPAPDGAAWEVKNGILYGSTPQGTWLISEKEHGDYAVPPMELTGSLYKGVAPREQVYKPEDWNTCRITCSGSQMEIEMNGVRIINVSLSEQKRPMERGNPLKERPLKGHIGFQELSRGGSRVMIRNAAITELE